MKVYFRRRGHERLVARIRELIDNIRANWMSLDTLAVEVCRVDRYLGTYALPLLPSTVDLPGAVGDLARVLQSKGNLALAEQLARRSIQMGFNSNGMSNSSRKMLGVLCEIMDAMGQHAPPNEIYRMVEADYKRTVEAQQQAAAMTE